jgi:hypothetical protein
MERRMAELDRLDREYGLGTMPMSTNRRPRRERKSHGPVLPGLLITALLLGGALVWSPADDMEALRRLVGIGDERLGVLPETEFGQGSFSFLQVQRGSDEPVGYDPCRVIEVVVNPAGAPDNYPELAGDVAGIGGSVATGPPGRLRYVTGRVVLDQELFADFGPREAPFAQAIVDHELAHVVGLGHVDDPGELMFDDNLGRTTYGPGDREGLARLGSISC